MSLIHFTQGEYKEALEHIVHILSPGMCETHGCEGCKYEWGDALETAKAVLGLPIKRQKCLHCGALDQIYWHKDDPHPREVMTCHNCGKVAEERDKDFEWIEAPADVVFKHLVARPGCGCPTCSPDET